MMNASMIIAAVLIGSGFLFMFASLIGIVRFPDFFARLHAQGVGDTLGAFLILAGMMAAVGASLLSVKILLIFIIIVLTNPIGTNLMMIAAINQEDYQGYSSFMEGGSEDDGSSEAAEPVAIDDSPAVTEDNQPVIIDPEEESDNKDKEDKEVKEVKEDKINKDVSADKVVKEDTKKKDSRKARSRKRKPSMNMNRSELIEAAAERGIEVPEEATKREILELIYSNHDKNLR